VLREHELAADQPARARLAELAQLRADLPIGATVDATEFDNGEVFASCRDGSLTVAAESSSGQFSVVQTVKTPDGANTMALDPTAHKIYLPTSEIVPPPAGSTGRGSTKPDSFMIVVVSR
jgi:hypothetical protein